MKPRWEQHPALAELFAEHREQIENHRRLASQRLGCDVGWEWAAEEWMSNHFPEWKERKWAYLVAATAQQNYLRLVASQEARSAD